MAGPVAFEVYRFTAADLERLIGEASGASLPNEQTKYLCSYLLDPESRAHTILRESPYADRHYIEEYSRYYAKSLRPPPSHGTRLRNEIFERGSNPRCQRDHRED